MQEEGAFQPMFVRSTTTVVPSLAVKTISFTCPVLIRIGQYVRSGEGIRIEAKATERVGRVPVITSAL